MEVLEERTKEFLKVETGYGYGSGHGYGSGFGDGYGDGYGDGDGSGYGSGYGYSSGYGYGYSSGSGFGDGFGDGLKSINNQKTYRIDGIDTIIDSIHNNIARGFIVNRDLTLEKCYIAKGQDKFAHGETIKDAVENLRNKIFLNLDYEKRIEEFRKKFEKDVKYKCIEFYKWHNLLTGSCELGRKAFVKNHDINIDTDTYTVQEFIEITKNDYGGEHIKKLEKYYK